MKINWKSPGKEVEEILKKEFGFSKSRKGWDINIVGIKIELPKEMAITFIKYIIKNIKYFIFKYKDDFPEKFKLLYALEIKHKKKEIALEEAAAAAAAKNPFPGMPPGWTPNKPLPPNWRPTREMNMPRGWRPGLQLPPNWNPVAHIAPPAGSYPGMPPGWRPGGFLPPNWRPTPTMIMPKGWKPGLQLPPGWNPIPQNLKKMQIGGKPVDIDISAPPPPPPPRIILSPKTNKPVLVMDDE